MNKASAVLHGDFGRAHCLEIKDAVTVHAVPQAGIYIRVGGPELEITTSDSRSCLGKSQIQFVAPWQPRTYKSVDGDHGSRMLAIFFDLNWLERYVRNTSLDLKQSSSVDIFRDVFEYFLLENINIMGCKLNNSENTYVEIIEDTYAGLLQAIQSQYEESSKQLNVWDYRIRRALSYLEDNLGWEFDCCDIASAAGLSRPHFFKMFKENTGLTPRLFYNALRLEAALKRLEDRTFSIQGISLELGFSAQSNFTKFFKNHIGIPPVVYRDCLRVVSC